MLLPYKRKKKCFFFRVHGKFQRFFIIIFFILYFSPCLCQAESELFLESSPFTEEESILFQEIPSVYSASKYEQKVTEAPSSVTIITADEIKKYGYLNFAEILRSVRGFYVTYDRNYHYLGVRGFGLPGDYNTRILLLIDGHRINDAIYEQAPLGTDFPIDIGLIERIEIIRGPGSSLYGTNAFFAVINVITRRGREFKGVEASGTGGSFETYKGRVSYGNKFQNGLEMLLSGSYYSSEGDDRLSFKEFDNPENNNGIAEDLDNDRFTNLFNTYLFHDFTLQLNYHRREKVVPTAPFDSRFNERFFTADERGWADLKYERIFDDQLNFLARLNYNFYDYNDNYFSNELPQTIKTSDDVDSQWLQGELQLTKILFEKHKSTIGFDYRDSIQQDQRIYNHIEAGAIPGVQREILDDKHDTQYWAVYFQDEYTITDYLTLHAGFRFDYFYTFGNAISPRTALIFNPVQNTTFKLIYGRAFRAPNAYELYYSDGISQKSSSHLDPETIDTYEIIYEQYFGKFFRGTIVGFYNTIDDLIALRNDSRDGLVVFDNIEDIRSKGIESELEAKWENGFEGRTSYTIQETEDDRTGEILINSPKHLATFNIIIPLIKRKLFLSGEEQYTSKRKTISRRYAEDFFVTNVTLYTRNIFQTLEVSGGVFNLFNKEYEDPGGEEHVQDTIEQDGRIFRIKVTYAF